MTFTFNAHISSLNELAYGHRLQQFQNNPLSSLFHTEKPMSQNLTELSTKLRENRSAGSGGEDF